MHLFRRLAWGLAIVFVLLSAWRWRERWWTPPAPPARAIVFDNGSVRQPPAPAEAASVAATPQAAPGVMRKCVRKAEVVYTDRPCPPGLQEREIDKSRFNTVEGR